MEQRLLQALRALAGLTARLRLLRELNLRAALLAALKDREMLRAVAPYAVVSTCILLAFGLTWSKATSGGSEHAGFHVKCAAPDCGYHFLVPRDRAQTYPRGSDGGGLKCKKCGRFSGRMAVRCSKCEEWYIAGSSDSASGCPKCRLTSGGGDEKKLRTGRDMQRPHLR